MPILLKKASLLHIFPWVFTRKYLQEKLERCLKRGTACSSIQGEEFYPQVCKELSLSNASAKNIMAYCIVVHQKIKEEKSKLGFSLFNKSHAEDYLQQMQDFEKNRLELTAGFYLE